LDSIDYDRVKITVSDNGQGIKKKDQGKLFKMFGSIKNAEKNINPNGIGLGLVISQLIAEKFGGEISFKSKFGVGT